MVESLAAQNGETHDLAAIAHSSYFADAVSDRVVVTAVGQNKSFFFVEKDTDDGIIDYRLVAAGLLKIVPEGEAREALALDYANMLSDAVRVRLCSKPQQ